jgi:hypothetical protein
MPSSLFSLPRNAWLGFALALSLAGAPARANDNCLQAISPLYRFEVLAGQSGQHGLPTKIGTSVRFHSAYDRGGAGTSAYFLGRIVAPEGDDAGILVYEATRNLVHLVPMDQIEGTLSDGTVLRPEQLLPVMRSRNQVEATCQPYAMNNCISQLARVRAGQPNLANADQLAWRRTLSTEVGRSELLVRALLQRFDSKNTPLAQAVELAKPFGFVVYDIPRNNLNDFKAKFLEQVGWNWPTVVSFDVAESMGTHEANIIAHGSTDTYLRELWLPMRKGQTKADRHVVVALGTIPLPNGQTKILILDSNWRVPRLWDSSELDYLGSADMTAWVFHEILPP